MPAIPEEDELLRRVRDGDADALATLFQGYRSKLLQMVRLRLDRRLQGRVDPSDVLQTVYIDVAKRIGGYLENPKAGFYLWLRFLTAQRLSEVHRRHLGAQARDARREISLYGRALPQASSISLAERLLADATSPSQAAIRAELRGILQNALNSMDPIDREVLALRHFEDLANNEVAEVLGISKSAASNRYVRALRRLKDMLPPDLLAGSGSKR